MTVSWWSRCRVLF